MVIRDGWDHVMEAWMAERDPSFPVVVVVLNLLVHKNSGLKSVVSDFRACQQLLVAFDLSCSSSSPTTPREDFNLHSAEPTEPWALRAGNSCCRAFLLRSAQAPVYCTQSA